MTKVQGKFLTQMLEETSYYYDISQIESLVELDQNLAHIPAQPLFFALVNMSSDQAASLLPKLSKEQKQFIFDMGCWERDHLDPQGASKIMELYAQCGDPQTIQKFSTSEAFLLFLKARLHLHTFDVENPIYPDHDYYFLTEDRLFLVEYDEDFLYASELKFILKNLYAKLGVEKAYRKIYGLIMDTYSGLEEEEFQKRQDRLRDYGIPNYIEAKHLTHSFSSLKQIENLIERRKKEKMTQVSELLKNQSLHYQMTQAFSEGIETLEKELGENFSSERMDFLRFDFIRLINSCLVSEDAFIEGKLALNRIAKEAHQFIQIAIDYIKPKEQNYLNFLLFTDLLKIGKSLISIEQNQLKKTLQGSFIDSSEHEYFAGHLWNRFIEASFEKPSSLQAPGSEEKFIINSFERFKDWKKWNCFFQKLTPYAQEFFNAFEKMRMKALLNDSFYLNYSVDQIDFEALIISNYVNYFLGHYQKENSSKKLGVTLQEFLSFIQKDYMQSASLIQFAHAFGFEQIQEDFELYLKALFQYHLDGYDFESMTQEDFQHIGGPIILQGKLDEK